MHWKQKAFLQKVVANLPFGLSDFAYHLIMKYGGGYVPYMDSTPDFEQSLRIIECARHHGHDISQATFFELGTGRVLSTAIGLWLLGANKIITVDLNSYLREEVTLVVIDQLNDEAFVHKIFGDWADDPEMKKRIKSITSCHKSLHDIFQLTGIDYRSPCDATQLSMADASIDIYFSSFVLEHVPVDVITALSVEARRVLSNEGLFIHYVGVSDHYAEYPSEPCGDPAISTVNFLQFSENKWMQISGNKFNFHNRLRAVEYKRLFESNGLEILLYEEISDQKALDLLQGGT
ncbi:MAG: methyltransferase domain-containing protein, partial [Magnetococcales bacterium]|nr:methyltransferase domain-containing protein [Magnetococcales bacterium]